MLHATFINGKPAADGEWRCVWVLRVYSSAQDCQTAGQSSTPDCVKYLRLGLGNKCILVNVGERLWFCLKFGKHIFMPAPKHNHKVHKV